MRHLVLSSILAFSTVACVGEQYGASAPSPSQPSMYSSSVGSSVSSDRSVSVNVGSRPGPNDLVLVVRPDLVELAFALSREGEDPDKTLSALKERADALAQQIKAAAGPLEARMCGATTHPVGKGKVFSESGPVSYQVHIDGSFEIALKPEQDYWARSRVMASLAKTTREITAAEKAAQSDKEPGTHIGFSEPRLRVKDPEQYREKLLARWLQRTRKLAALAEAEKSPLALVDCTPPGEIEQRIVSMEEITLSLPVTCRMGAPGAERARAGQ